MDVCIYMLVHCLSFICSFLMHSILSFKGYSAAVARVPLIGILNCPAPCFAPRDAARIVGRRTHQYSKSSALPPIATNPEDVVSNTSFGTPCGAAGGPYTRDYSLLGSVWGAVRPF